MNLHNMTDEKKEQITEHVERTAKFKKGDLVTVDYNSNGHWFANAEYGGIPLRVTGITWRENDVSRIKHEDRYRELHEEEDMLNLFDEDDELMGHETISPYVTIRPSYNLEVAVRSDVECPRTINENCLVPWDEYEGRLQFHLRNTKSTSSLREGVECVVCGFEAEKVSEASLPDGTRYGSVECAVCGYVKEEHSP